MYIDHCTYKEKFEKVRGKTTADMDIKFIGPDRMVVPTK
jgi:hypothetical protein